MADEFDGTGGGRDERRQSDSEHPTEQIPRDRPGSGQPMPPGGAGDTTADYDALTNPPSRPSFDDNEFANYDGDIYGTGAGAGGDEFDGPGQPTRPGGASDLVNR